MNAKSVNQTKGLLLGVLLLCTGMQFFSYGGNTAMGPLLTALGGYQYYSLVASLGSAGTMMALPAVGAIGGKIGRRTVILLGITIMLLSRTAMQSVDNVYLLMMWQMLGSVGMGLIMSAPYAIVGSLFERVTAMRYYGFIATFNALGALCGPLLSGRLVDAARLRLPFLIWIPLVGMGVLLLMKSYPNTRDIDATKFDWLGLGYLAVFVVTLVLWLGLSGKLFPWISMGLVLPVITAAAAVLLLRHSKEVERPAVPLYMFQYKRFRTAFFSNLLLVTFSTCAAGYVLIYILYTMNKSTTLGATSTMPSTVLIMVCGLFMGRILARNFEKNVRTLMVICSLCIFSALLCFSLLTPESSMIQVWLGSALGGIGNSIAQTCLTPYFQHGLPKEEFAAAQGMYQFSSTCGSSLFGAVVGVLMGLNGGDPKAAFYLACALAFINIILVVSQVRIKTED